MPTPNLRHERGRRQEGSAYLVALLLLVVLTLMGLSLALVTNTENQIGVNERVLERVFYTTDAGLGIGAARVLVSSDYYYDVDNNVNNSYILNETPGANTSPLVRSTVSVGPLVPLQVAPCNLCEINNSGSYRDASFQRGNILLPAQGSRETLANTTAQRRIGATMDVQPWRVPTSALFPVLQMDPAELAEKAAL